VSLKLGYHLSSEEHGPHELVDHARRAEELGFDFLTISDHFHPWAPKQGSSPFVWSVIGGIARETERIQVMTFVTCPIIRVHPAIVAQAAATSACMLPDRFILGVGTGERLNEGVVGAHWPAPDLRVDMFEEALEVIKELWKGEETNFHGDFYDVEQAKLYTLPDSPPPIYVAATAPRITRLAAEYDGYINTKPDEDMVKLFVREAGDKKPRVGKVDVCYAKTEEQGVKTAMDYWPHSWAGGSLNQELLSPEDFAALGEGNSEEKVKEAMPVGPDADELVKKVKEWEKAGFTHLAVHQYGPDQDGFFDWWESEVKDQLGATARQGSLSS
jgi:coenzyme F420-dependent glucose-6-phosphate dehydrogenase